MIKFERTVTLGEKQFKVVANRDIAVKSFEQYPDVIIYLKEQEKSAKSNKNEDDLFVELLKNKQLGKMFEINDKMAELVKFALPLMLAEANDNSNADEIISYAEENDAAEQFNAKIFELITNAFTQRGQEKPKIQFSMK